MPQITSKQLTEIRQLAVRLLDYVDAIEGVAIEVSPEIAEIVEKRVSQRICLACGQQAMDGEQMRRGQDPACYATTRSRIRRGVVSERQLIEQGKLTAEAASSGRPAKQDIAASQAAGEDLLKQARAAEPKEKYRKKKGG